MSPKDRFRGRTIRMAIWFPFCGPKTGPLAPLLCHLAGHLPPEGLINERLLSKYELNMQVNVRPATATLQPGDQEPDRGKGKSS